MSMNAKQIAQDIITMSHRCDMEKMINRISYTHDCNRRTTINAIITMIECLDDCDMPYYTYKNPLIDMDMP